MTGLTYQEIANRYYYRNLNKVLYEVKKAMQKFNVTNRRQLVYAAFCAF